MITPAQFTTAVERAARETNEHVPGVKVLENYSGRGMYGRTCIGVTLPVDASVTLFAMYLTIEVQNLLDDGGQVDQDELARFIRSVQFDDLGRGRVAYYPDQPYTKE